jgi:REP element-mobilizing transposase RayT
MYVQTVFAVKYRKAILHKNWRQELFAVIGNVINETGCNTIIVNGVEDHVHCFFRMTPSKSVSEIMQAAKAKSSKWINENNFLDHRFEWQRGFGAFSYSQSSVKNVFRYIEKQEAHHEKQKLNQEYIKMLKHYEIPFDDQYLFEDLI